MSHAMLSRQLGLPLRLAIRERESGVRDPARPHGELRRMTESAWAVPIDIRRELHSRRMPSSTESSSFAEVLGQKTQHKIAVHLQQLVLASIASVGGRIR